MQIADKALIRCHKEVGWRCYSTSFENNDAFADLLLQLARRMGTVVPGRNGALIEPIFPRPREMAETRSLSAAYGLGELPMHIDTAHHLWPARFLLIGCADAGRLGARTRLVQISKLKFTPGESSLLASAAMLVRTGRRSFYSTILDKGRPFFRYDPGCMEPVDERGAEALRIVHDAIQRVEVSTHDWQRGEILAIDNWAMLHGRTVATADNRLLLRVSVQ